MLKWSQANMLGHVFELSDESGNILGKLEIAKFFGNRAVGEYDGKRFQFQLAGIVRPTIRMINELEETVALVRLRWKMHLKTEIELASGIHYRMFSFGVIGRNWKLRDEEGRELCGLVEKWDLMRSSGLFTPSDVRGTNPEPGFLALLMWYVTLMISYQESATAT